MIVTDGTQRVLCYPCYLDSDETIDYWLPDIPENYPAQCDACSWVCTGPGVGHFENPEDQ